MQRSREGRTRLPLFRDLITFELKTTKSTNGCFSCNCMLLQEHTVQLHWQPSSLSRYNSFTILVMLGASCPNCKIAIATISIRWEGFDIADHQWNRNPRLPADLSRLTIQIDTEIAVIRERKLNTNFFFSNFSGTSGISQQNPGISRQKSLIPWVSRDIPNFLAPTPSRGRPPPHQKISGLKSLGLGSFFVPEWFESLAAWIWNR